MTTDLEDMLETHVDRLLGAVTRFQKLVTLKAVEHANTTASMSDFRERLSEAKLLHVGRLDAMKLAMELCLAEEKFVMDDFAAAEGLAAKGLAAGELAVMKEEYAKRMEELTVERLALAEEQAVSERVMKQNSAEEREVEDYLKMEPSIARQLSGYKEIAVQKHVVAHEAVETLVDVLLQSGVFVEYHTLLRVADHLASSLSQTSAFIQNMNGTPLGTWT